MPHTIVTLSTPNLDWYAAHSIKTKQRYAEENGYEFISERAVRDSSRHPSWSKVKILLEQIDRYRGDPTRWLWWTDADLFILNRSVRLEQFTTGIHDLVVTQAPYRPINAGSFMVRVCAWSERFLNTIWNDCRPSEQQHTDWEQHAVIRNAFAVEDQTRIAWHVRGEFNNIGVVYRKRGALPFTLHMVCSNVSQHDAARTAIREMQEDGLL